MGKKWGLLCAAVIILPGQAEAESDQAPPPMSLEHQEAMENVDDFTGALEDLANLVTTKSAAAKKTHCMKAIGNPVFCECIAKESPVGVDFIGYVTITAGTKKLFKYDQLSDEDKKLFDATRAARDKCVTWRGADPLGIRE